MNGTRPARRFSMAMLLALCAALALGSFWMLEVMRKAGEDNAPAGARTEPDYFVDDFTFVRMSKTGQAEYRISGEKLTHHPNDDTHHITLPVVTTLAAEQPPMTARSQRAVVDRNSSQIQMMDNVTLNRAATANSDAMLLTTSYLLVLPDEDVMRTDKPVEITVGQSKLTGTGMVANNTTRQLDLASDVHAFYQPPAATR
jgi:lipopolysaccharide export system protein LptC